MLEVGIRQRLRHVTDHTSTSRTSACGRSRRAAHRRERPATQGEPDRQILAILTNKEVIALDQDALGLQGIRSLRRAPTAALGVGQAAQRNGARGVVLLNAGDGARRRRASRCR